MMSGGMPPLKNAISSTDLDLSFVQIRLSLPIQNQSGNVTMHKDAVKSEPNIDKDWNVRQELIDGVRIKEIKNVLTSRSVLTEVFRSDWQLHSQDIRHIIHVSFLPGAINAWHCHKYQTDHLSCVYGLLRVVLYDDRNESATYGRINVFQIGQTGPKTIVIPPAIWHGFQNLHDGYSNMINFFDRPFDRDDPDHFSLPYNHTSIPYSFDHGAE